MRAIQRIGLAVTTVLAVGVGYGLAGLPTTGATSMTQTSIPVLLPGRGRQPAAVATPAAMPDRTPTPRDAGSEANPAPSVLSLLSLPSEFDQTAGLYALIADADLESLQTHIREARRIAHVPDRRAAMSILFLRYADLDPDGAMPFLDSTGIEERDGAVYSMFNAWARHDLDGALARIVQTRPGNERMLASNAIVQAHEGNQTIQQQLIDRLTGGSGWAGVGGRAPALPTGFEFADPDPAVAFEDALTETNPRRRSGLLNAVASAWAGEDAGTALRRSGEIPRARERTEFRHSVLRAAAGADPRAALDLLDELPGRGESELLLNLVFQPLARADGPAALRLAAALPKPGWRRTATMTAVQSWSHSDPRGAAQAALRYGEPSILRQIGHELVQSYLQIAPEETLEWAELADGREGGDLWHSALVGYAELRPDRALAIVSELPPSQRKAQLLGQVLGALAGTEPERAAELAAQLPPGPLRFQAMTQVAYRWAESDAPLALDWVVRQPLAFQNQALANLAHRVVHADPVLARDFASRLASEPLAQWVGAILWRLAGDDPWETALWLLDFADEPGYGGWVGTVAAQLVELDPPAALELIESLPTGTRRAEAVATLVSHWAQVDPPAAASWLARQDPADIDRHVFIRVAQHWQRYDPAAAERWAIRLEPSEQRDRALATLVAGTVAGLEHMLTLVDAIQSDVMREQAIEQQVRQLAHADPASAQALIDRAPLTDAYRHHLADQLQQLRTVPGLRHVD